MTKPMSNKNLARWSAAFIKPFFPVIFFLLLFALAGNYASTFEPLFTGKIIDSLTVKDRQSFFFFLKIIIVFQIANLIFSLLSSCFQFLLQRKLTIYTESRLYLNLLYVPPKGNTQKNVGNLVNLFATDLATMTGIYTSQIPSIITAIVMICVLGVRLFKIDIVLFCLTLAVSVIPIFWAKYFGTKQATINKEQKEQQDIYTSFITESVFGLQDIKNYSAQKFFMQRFRNILSNIFNYIKKYTIVTVQSVTANFFTNFTINISLFAIVGLTVLDGKNTVGTITVALLYSQKLRSLVSSCSETYKSIIISFVSVERLKNIFDARQKNNSIIECEKNNCNVKKIQLSNLTFSYKENKNIFTDINGEFIFPGLYLIKGENGSGKTTLLNIIAGNIQFHDNYLLKGEIIFYNLEHKFSYVSQKPFVFSGTIEENICFGKAYEKSIIDEAFHKTKLQEVIQALPLGMRTLLGGSGHTLSQGQMQRLALTRSLLQTSEIILFDEVENALDAETNDALQNILSELKLTKLILMVTHKNTYDKIANGILHL